ncbi:MAG: DUF3347 domain-containing protein [Calditrichia bacterium]
MAKDDDLVRKPASANAQNAAKTLTAKIDAMANEATGMNESMATAKRTRRKNCRESDLAKRQREMFLPLSEAMISVAKSAGSEIRYMCNIVQWRSIIQAATG